MKSTLVVSVSSLLLALAGCGGGGDWEATAAVQCKTALLANGMDAQSVAPYGEALYGVDGGSRVDITSGNTKDGSTYVYASCLVTGGKVVSITRRDGSVIKL